MNYNLIYKMQKIKNNLTAARNDLKNVNAILNESINFSDYGFKNGALTNMNSRLDTQIYNIDYKIIPEVKKM